MSQHSQPVADLFLAVSTVAFYMRWFVARLEQAERAQLQGAVARWAVALITTGSRLAAAVWEIVARPGWDGPTCTQLARGFWISANSLLHLPDELSATTLELAAMRELAAHCLQLAVDIHRRFGESSGRVRVSQGPCQRQATLQALPAGHSDAGVSSDATGWSDLLELGLILCTSPEHAAAAAAVQALLQLPGGMQQLLQGGAQQQQQQLGQLLAPIVLGADQQALQEAAAAASHTQPDIALVQKVAGTMRACAVGTMTLRYELLAVSGEPQVAAPLRAAVDLLQQLQQGRAPAAAAPAASPPPGISAALARLECTTAYLAAGLLPLPMAWLERAARQRSGSSADSARELAGRWSQEEQAQWVSVVVAAARLPAVAGTLAWAADDAIMGGQQLWQADAVADRELSLAAEAFGAMLELFGEACSRWVDLLLSAGRCCRLPEGAASAELISQPR